MPIAALGGAAGAALLLSTPAEGFEKTVPVLLGLAAVLIAVPNGRASRRDGGQHPRRRTATVMLEAMAIFLIAVYGGYFGAAAGVLLLALLLGAGGATLPHANAAKNVILGVANTVAAVAFTFLAPVQWLAVIPLGMGCLLGSRLGPVVVRHAPATKLRLVIAAAGLALAVKLGIDAYA